MQIKCENCKTEYSLDEKLLSPKGTPVRCTHCGNVFKAFPPGAAETTAGAAKPRGQGVTAQAKNATRHQTMSGAAAKFSDPAPAKKPITIRSIPSQRNTEPPPPLKKALPNAQPQKAKGLSDASRKSLEMGRTLISSVPPPATTATAPRVSTPSTMPQQTELPVESATDDALATGNTIRESFVIGETIRATNATPSMTPLPEKTSDPIPEEHASSFAETSEPILDRGTVDDRLTPLSMSDEPDFSQVPATQDEQWSDEQQEIDDDEPDWTNVSSTMNAIPTFDDDFAHPQKRRAMLFVIIGLIVALGGGAAYMYFFQRDLLINQFGEAQDSKKIERQNTLLLEAREKVLLDTFSDFSQAEKKYLQVLAIDNHNAAALAALGQMYAVWSQYLLDARLDAIADAGNNNVPAAGQLKKEFETKLAEARRRVTAALKIDPELKDAHIAAAEVELLSGNLDGAKAHLAKGRSENTVQGSGYVSAQIGIVENQNPIELIGMLKTIVVAEPLLRVLYRLARIQAADGKKADALQSLDQILQLNKKHTAALQLKERLLENKPVRLIPDDWKIADTDTEAAANDIIEESPDSQTSEAVDEKSDGKHDDDDDEGMSVDRMIQKAATAQENGRTQEAVDLYNRVLRESPSNVDALSGIAYTYLDKGNHGQAIAKFKRALDISPQFGPAIIGMAQTYKSMGQKKEALKWFRKYVETNPSGRHAGMAQRNIDDLADEVDAGNTSNPYENDAAAASTAGSDSGTGNTAASATESTTPPTTSSTESAGAATGSSAADTEPSNTGGAKDTPQ